MKSTRSRDDADAKQGRVLDDAGRRGLSVAGHRHGGADVLAESTEQTDEQIKDARRSGKGLGRGHLSFSFCLLVVLTA